MFFFIEKRNLLNQLQIEDSQITDSIECLAKLKNEVMEQIESNKIQLFNENPVCFQISQSMESIGTLIGVFDSKKAVKLD